jgi:hypothetical protein
VVDLPSALTGIAKNEGLLNAVYNDLAAPGVRQVGKALETVFQTGNIVLLPLRWLNETVAQFERKSFHEIAVRFKEIPNDDVIDVRPEIGTPIIERLSTTADPDLRALFIELLATAADRKAVEFAHPSFVRVIENLSPDEAKVLAEWNGRDLVPCLMIGFKGEDQGNRTLYDPFVEIPDSLSSPNLASMYIANLTGLGLVIHHRDSYVTTDGAYNTLIEGIQRDLPAIKEQKLSVFRSKDLKVEPGDHFYKKGCLEITPYGKAFQRACLPPRPIGATPS